MTITPAQLEQLRIPPPESTPSSFPAWILGLVVLAGRLGVGLWWFKQPSTLTVTVMTVQANANTAPLTAVALNASGYVVARRRATLSANTTGRVVEMLAEEGVAVTAGTLLARLEPQLTQRQLQLAQAQWQAQRAGLAEIEARLREAKTNLHRADQLASQHFTDVAAQERAQAEHDALLARLSMQQAQIKAAYQQVLLRQTELDELEIKAPFNGVIVSRDAQIGEMVSPFSAGGGFTRTGIATLVDMDSLEIEVDVNESYLQRVTVGQGVEAVLDAYPDWKIAGQVSHIIPTADRQKATVKIRIQLLPPQSDPRLLPDMGVKVAFLQAASATAPADPAIRRFHLPQSTVFTVGEQTFVWVVQANQLERRAVKVGAVRDATAEIQAGLRPGEQVIVDAAIPQLQAGATVKILPN